MHRYCKLDILIESMELPRSPSDRNKVYSVISGRIKAVTGDWSDPQLMVLARLAADELLSIKNIHKDLNVDEEASAGLPFASDAARGTEGDKYEALMKLGLGSEYHHKRVRKRIWRQMIEVAHSGGMPSRQKALLMMEELGIAADSLVEGEKKPGPASATGSSLLDIDEGQSFSGWDLDCRAEGGAKLESVVQLPPKIQGAVTEQNSLVCTFPFLHISCSSHDTTVFLAGGLSLCCEGSVQASSSASARPHDKKGGGRLLSLPLS